MQHDWEVGVNLHALLTSALVGNEWKVSRSGHYVSGDEPPGTHCVGYTVAYFKVSSQTWEYYAIFN
jgi:hypothetical protein